MDTQEKYNKLITLMLEKVNTPLDGCVEVLKRIAILMDMDLVPKTPRPGPEQAQLLFNTLAKAESVAENVQGLEWHLMRKQQQAVKVAGLLSPRATKTIRSRNELEALLDKITIEPVREELPEEAFQQTRGPMGFNKTTNTIDYAKKNQLSTQPVRSKPIEPRLDAPMFGRAIEDAMSQAGGSRKSLYYKFSIENLEEKPSGYSVTSTHQSKPTPDLTSWGASAPAAPSAMDSPSTPTAPADDAPIEIVIPKWTKGPPCTPSEVEEYKQYMIARYEAEQRQNAEILRQMKLKAAAIK